MNAKKVMELIRYYGSKKAKLSLTAMGTSMHPERKKSVAKLEAKLESILENAIFPLYKIGDEVWVLSHVAVGKDANKFCKSCGKLEHLAMKWEAIKGQVGKVKFEFTDIADTNNYYESIYITTEFGTQFTCKQDIFPSKELAEKACDGRNK